MLKDLFKKIWFLWVLGFVVNSIAFLLVWNKVGQNNYTFVLHYNTITGIDWYGPVRFLYQIPLAGLFLNVVNFTLFKFLRQGKLFYSPLIGGVNLVVQIVLFFYLILIFLAN